MAEAPRSCGVMTADASAHRDSLPCRAQVKTLFEKIDADQNGEITKEEATRFFKSFPKVSAQAMFNEVDDDDSGGITFNEWIAFWENVISQPTYEEDDICEELDNILEGGSWVDFNDGRTT